MITRFLVFAAALLVLSSAAWSQVPDDPAEYIDVDSLFEAPDDEAQNGSGGADDTGGTVLDDVLEREPFELGANIRLALGYSPGLKELPWLSEPRFHGVPVLDLEMTLSARYTFSRVFAVRQRLEVSYPDYQFDVTELAVDYSFKDRLFLSAGLQRLSWGRSPNYPFADLTNRSADDPIGESGTSGKLMLRATLPLGIGGLQTVAISTDDYLSDPAMPSAEELGYGLLADFAAERLDVELGVYYQRDLNTRAFAAVNTTLSQSVETYVEGLVAVDWQNIYTATAEQPVVELRPGVTKRDNPVDLSAAIGVIVSLFSNAVDLNLEYFFNGEESENTVADARWPLFYGHNVAVNILADIPDSPARLQVKAEHNFFHQSGIVAPALILETGPNVSVFIGLVGVYGPEEAAYAKFNPDPDGRPLYMIASLVFSGKI